MCIAVYVASDHPLPETAAAGCDGLALGQTSDEMRQLLQHALPLKHIAYIGPKESCGCDFELYREPDPALYEPSDLATQLAMYFDGLARAGPARLLVCWLGDEARRPEVTAELGGALLRDRLNDLAERTLVLSDACRAFDAAAV